MTDWVAAGPGAIWTGCHRGHGGRRADRAGVFTADDGAG